MGIYQEAIQILLSYPATDKWPLLRQAVERAEEKKPIAWDFPVKACKAVGAEATLATPAVAAITCAHMALILIDDLLDEDPRGAHIQLGIGRAANLATGLSAMGINILLRAEECQQPEHAALALNEAIEQTAYGQDLDVQNPRDEQSYWKVTQAKSSPYFGACLYIGSLFGGASLQMAGQLKRFGEIFGEIMQIHDDLNDCLASPANVDWLQGRSPLPILFAELVDHPDREHFLALRHHVENLEVLQEAQTILVRCGAISYSVSELTARVEKAKQILLGIKLVDPNPLMELLEKTMAPVNHLLSSVGVVQPEWRRKGL